MTGVELDGSGLTRDSRRSGASMSDHNTNPDQPGARSKEGPPPPPPTGWDPPPSPPPDYSPRQAWDQPPGWDPTSRGRIPSAPRYGYGEPPPLDPLGRTLAPWWKRALAYIIDGVVVGVPMYFIFDVAVGVRGRPILVTGSNGHLHVTSSTQG